MFVDVLKRYLLIVWNFFFGQGSTESIQEGPKDDQPAAAEPEYPVPSAAVDAKQDEVANEEDVDDDIEEIFDDEQEEGEEEEEEEEGDEQEEEDDEVEEDESADEKADVPKKPEDKTVGSNDVPAAKPAGKAEDAAKKQPEAPKTSDVKPDEPKAAKDLPKVDVKPSKPEFEIVEREDAKPAPPAKDASKPEFVARESVAVVKPAAAKDTTPAATTTPTPTTTATKSNQDFEIVDREALKVAPEKDGAKEKADKDDDAAKPKDDAKKTVHVKFEDEVAGKGDGRDVKVAGAQKPQANAEFVVSEKGEDGGPKSAAGREAIDSFLLGEQRHSGGVHHHPESIQDQQLEYSDSGEELSDDDIEIDYEDDEDDEEVEEVKPLPPVARSVYKKND